MTRPERTRRTAVPISESAEPAWDDVDPQLLRIRRIGMRLFGVANCVIEFCAASVSDRPAQLAIIGEKVLSLSPSDAPVVMTDIRAAQASRQRTGNGSASVMRFHASHPVYNPDRSLAGSIGLYDPAPRRSFGHEEQRMLGDLAALVERELELRSVSASQFELQKKNKSLQRKSLVDPLIGTWNRGAIMRILSIEAIRCDKAGEPLSLIVADLDYFKKINDSYGHPAGDEVLVKVASRLRSCIRPREALGRYGGEEFLVVLPGSSHQVAVAVAERMRAAIAAQPESVQGAMLNLTISAGVASTDMFPTATTEELISRADVALYAAKDAGRNRVINATPDLS